MTDIKDAERLTTHVAVRHDGAIAMSEHEKGTWMPNSFTWDLGRT
jgi:hypothetical protein